MTEEIIVEKEFALQSGVFGSVLDAFDPCHLSGCDVKASDNLFPTQEVAGKFMLMTIAGMIGSEKVLDLLKEKKLKPADFSGLLAFAKKFPADGHKPIIALGSVLKGEKQDAVPAIWKGCSPEQRSVHLFKASGHEWTPGTQFLAQVIEE